MNDGCMNCIFCPCHWTITRYFFHISSIASSNKQFFAIFLQIFYEFECFHYKISRHQMLFLPNENFPFILYLNASLFHLLSTHFTKKATIEFSVSILFKYHMRDYLPFFSDNFSMRSYNSMLTWHPRRDMTKRVERDQTNIIGVRFLLAGSNSFLNFVLNLI